MFNWFNPVPKEGKISRQLRERTEARVAAIHHAQESVFANIDAEEIARDAVRKAVAKRGAIEQIPASLLPLARALVSESGIFDDVDATPFPKTTSERIRIEGRLTGKEHMLENAGEALDLSKQTITNIIADILAAMSDTLLRDERRQFEVTLLDVLVDRGRLADGIIALMERASTKAADKGYSLFDGLLSQIDLNAKSLAGIGATEDWGRKRRPRIEDYKTVSEEETIREIFAGTSIGSCLSEDYALPLPVSARFEHSILLARTGWGKSRALEWLINEDFNASLTELRSVIVMESEGSLIDRLSRHPVFDPAVTGNIADRLVVINPGRAGCMPELSLFDLGTKDLSRLTEMEREKAVRNSVDLFEYVFRAIKGSELTDKQSFVFSQLVHLMVWIKGASFDTLIECLEDDALAVQYAASTPPRLREFFEKKYGDKQFKETKTQIYQRLETFRTTGESFVRLLSGKKSSFNFLDAINSGKIVLINTNKEHLGEDGSKVLGRFMTALIRQASINRPIETGCPCFFYMDEAQEYLDERAQIMFAQARKRRIGLTVAFQCLSDVGPVISKGILTNTNNRICGQVETSDRETMAKALRCSPAFISGLQRKAYAWGEFAIYFQDITNAGAVKARIPYGTLERVGLNRVAPAPIWPIQQQPTLGSAAQATQHTKVRQTAAASANAANTSPTPSTLSTVPASVAGIWKK